MFLVLLGRLCRSSIQISPFSLFHRYGVAWRGWMPNQVPGFELARGAPRLRATMQRDRVLCMHVRTRSVSYSRDRATRVCVCVVVRGGSDRDPREGHLEMSLAVRGWRLVHEGTLQAASDKSALRKLEPNFQMPGLVAGRSGIRARPSLSLLPFAHRQQPAETGNQVPT